jgi:hypothetical protein
MRYSLIAWVSVAALIGGCTGFSKYSIDTQPLIKFDARLLGKWKAVEDTDKANYISIRLAIPSIITNKETAKHKDQVGYITYWNRHGKNQSYADWGSFLSKIGNSTFLNIDGTNTSADSIFIVGVRQKEGHYFAKIVHTSKNYDSVTIALVGDPTLRDLKSSKEVRERVTKNVNNPQFYSHTFHFYRVK